MLNLKFDDISGINNIVKFTKPDPFKGLEELLGDLDSDDKTPNTFDEVEELLG